MIFGGWFDRRSADEKLEAQKRTLDEIGEAVKKAAEEISSIRGQLVKKANGSLYSGLKVGAKPGEL